MCAKKLILNSAGANQWTILYGAVTFKPFKNGLIAVNNDSKAIHKPHKMSDASVMTQRQPMLFPIVPFQSRLSSAQHAGQPHLQALGDGGPVSESDFEISLDLMLASLY